MHNANSSCRNRYRLVVNDDEAAPAEVAEVDSLTPRAALQLAGRLYPGRAVEIFENDRLLGRVRNLPDGGYWIVELDGAARQADANRGARWAHG